jgi:hypothetical protein
VNRNFPEITLNNLPDGKETFDASFAYYVLTVTFSLCFLLLAHFKIKSAISNSRASYLLQMDERWSSSEIIKARKIIHELYLNTNPSKNSKQKVIAQIGDMILKIHHDPKRAEDFLFLLNFLDFLETVGFLHRKGHLTAIEIRELSGNSLVFYFAVFKEFVDYRRRTWNDTFYTEIEYLYKELENADPTGFRDIIGS